MLIISVPSFAHFERDCPVIYSCRTEASSLLVSFLQPLSKCCFCTDNAGEGKRWPPPLSSSQSTGNPKFLDDSASGGFLDRWFLVVRALKNGQQIPGPNPHLQRVLRIKNDPRHHQIHHGRQNFPQLRTSEWRILIGETAILLRGLCTSRLVCPGGPKKLCLS